MLSLSHALPPPCECRAVIAKMQHSHLQLLELLTDGLRFAGVPARAMQPLTSLRPLAMQRDPSWFNQTSNYEEATDLALKKQAAVFEYLANKNNEEMVLTQMEVGSIFEAAEARFLKDVAAHGLTPERCEKICPEGVSWRHVPPAMMNFHLPK